MPPWDLLHLDVLTTGASLLSAGYGHSLTQLGLGHSPQAFAKSIHVVWWHSLVWSKESTSNISKRYSSVLYRVAYFFLGFLYIVRKDHWCYKLKLHWSFYWVNFEFCVSFGILVFVILCLEHWIPSHDVSFSSWPFCLFWRLLTLQEHCHGCSVILEHVLAWQLFFWSLTVNSLIYHMV